MKPSNFEILACEDTPLGLACLRRRELLSRPGVFVTEMTLNHEFVMSSHVTTSERALARRALEVHQGSALRVLVGGLGLGYTAQEALVSDRVAQVEVVEYLPQVIGWFDQGLVPLADELKADSRLTVVAGDIYRRLAAPAEQIHDLILIDVDHSPVEPLGHPHGSFYTDAGLGRAKDHLADAGVLAVWSYDHDPPFADTLRRVFPDVRVHPITVVNDLVQEEQTDWLFLARK